MAKLMFNELGKIFGYSDAVRKERFRVKEEKRQLEAKGPANRVAARTRFVETYKGQAKKLVPVFVMKSRRIA